MLYLSLLIFAITTKEKALLKNSNDTYLIDS